MRLGRINIDTNLRAHCSAQYAPGVRNWPQAQGRLLGRIQDHRSLPATGRQSGELPRPRMPNGLEVDHSITCHVSTKLADAYRGTDLCQLHFRVPNRPFRCVT
jgi:hypothetical protein